MSAQPLKFRRIANDEDAQFLMPGQGADMTLVIFCGADAPVVDKARALSSEVEIPEAWSFAVVDPEVAADTARWFGVTEMPAMGAVYDGALLAVEYECSTQAFERLIELAQQQYVHL